MRILKIYDTSTASHVENKCSTYHRYASALFSASSLYLYRLFQKRWRYGASALSLHKKQSSTYNKYACGCFLYAPSIYITYFQKRWLCSSATDGGGFTQKRVRLRTRSPRMYRTYILGRACGCFLYAPSICRTAKDGSGFIQERDLGYAQISSFRSVHGCTLLNRLFQKAYGKAIYGASASSHH